MCTTSPLHPTQELEQWQQVFLDFYLKKYSGRKLQWYNSLGSCVLKASFPKGTKELSVSLFQAVVLCLFNDADTLSFQVGWELANCMTALHL
jgi:cullin-4